MITLLYIYLYLFFGAIVGGFAESSIPVGQRKEGSEWGMIVLWPIVLFCFVVIWVVFKVIQPLWQVILEAKLTDLINLTRLCRLTTKAGDES